MTYTSVLQVMMKYIEAYEARQKWQRDYVSGIESARREGIEKGIKKGLKKGIEQTARKMKKEGIPLKNIARITGLSVTRIEGL